MSPAAISRYTAAYKIYRDWRGISSTVRIYSMHDRNVIVLTILFSET